MKIHICGIYGSGKSTLAKILSKELKIPSYELDDLKYEVKYSKIRPVYERIRRVKEICNQNHWITEGSWSNYAEDAFRKADLIILMKTSKIISIFRVLKRHIFREKQEKDTLFGALKLSKEVILYHFSKKPVSLYMHKNLISKYNKTYYIITKKNQIKDTLQKIKEHIIFEN